jgi:CO/xanthine dehydrogenase FAD-binding subunit
VWLRIGIDTGGQREERMKPPPFEYVAGASTGEALAELARHGEAAKLLAGGHRLMPILNMRLGAPGDSWTSTG